MSKERNQMSNTTVLQTSESVNPPYNGIWGVDVGIYEAYIEGEYITKIYNDDGPVAAAQEWGELFESYHYILVFANGKESFVEWFSCSDCGKVNDVGNICDHSLTLAVS